MMWRHRFVTDTWGWELPRYLLRLKEESDIPAQEIGQKGTLRLDLISSHAG